MSQIDLYLQLQKNLVRGRNIETMVFQQWETPEGEIQGRIVITYLCGEKVIVPQNPVYTPQDREIILQQICALQEVPCYPSTPDDCELGITSLN